MATTTKAVSQAEIPLEQLRPNPWQPRSHVSPEDIEDLANNIHSVGLLQRPLVRPSPSGEGYQLAFGHNRVEAIRVLKERGDWPGDVPVEERVLSDFDMAMVALSENQKRRDLAPLDQWRAYQKALDEIEGLTIQHLADTLGLDRSTLSNNLRILALPKIVLERVDAHDLSPHAAREFLCLMGQDHAHTDIMESIIRHIQATHYGAAPDWRVGNIRVLIQGRVSGSRVAEWRRLEGSKGGFYGGSHSAYSPEFDVAKFKEEFGGWVHAVPQDGSDEHYSSRPSARKEGSLAWTCKTGPWKKWQDAAKAAKPQGKGNKEPPKTQRHLESDPVARKVMPQAVPPETAAQQVAEDLRIQQSQMASSEVHKADEKAVAWQKLNKHLANFLAGHPDKEARQNLKDSAQALGHSLDLWIAGITPEELASAVRKFVQDFEKRVAQQVKAPKVGDQEREQLGTRAEVVHLGYNREGHPLQESRLGSMYDGPPPYFPDLRECREKCTWGATYVTTYDRNEKPRLYCMNEEHWQEKLERGKKEYQKKLDKEIVELDRQDQVLAQALAERLPAELGHPLAAVVLASVREFRRTAPEAKGQPLHDFRYDPGTMTRVVELLGLSPPDGYYSISADEAWEAILPLDHEKARDVAAQLMTWAVRAKLSGEKDGVAQVLQHLGLEASVEKTK